MVTQFVPNNYVNRTSEDIKLYIINNNSNTELLCRSSVSDRSHLRLFKWENRADRCTQLSEKY